MLAAPPLREPITDRRIGGSSEFIDLNGVGALLTLLLFFVFRDLGPPRSRRVGPANEAALQ
jgi:hypothetical protein